MKLFKKIRTKRKKMLKFKIKMISLNKKIFNLKKKNKLKLFKKIKFKKKKTVYKIKILSIKKKIL